MEFATLLSSYGGAFYAAGTSQLMLVDAMVNQQCYIVMLR